MVGRRHCTVPVAIASELVTAASKNALLTTVTEPCVTVQSRTPTAELLVPPRIVAPLV